MVRKLLTFTLVLCCIFAAQTQAKDLINISREDHATVAINVYTPKHNICTGTAIISHGAGGSEEGYAYLADYLSDNGWLVMVPGHTESGRKALKEHTTGFKLKAGVAKLVTDPAAYQGRFMDIAAARQWSAKHCSSPFTALIGHSMGAATTMIEAGAKNKLGLEGKKGFDAYITISPQGSGLIFPKQAWQTIQQPLFMLTGTEDKELANGWTSRLEAFNDMPEGCKWLGIIDGASHKNFGGRGFSGKTEKLTTRYALLFLNSVKNGQCGVPPTDNGIELHFK